MSSTRTFHSSSTFCCKPSPLPCVLVLMGCALLAGQLGCASNAPMSSPSPQTPQTPQAAQTFALITDGSGDVVVLNTKDDSTAATIPMSGGPAGIAVSHDGSRFFVANSVANNVAVVDTASHSVLATISLGASCTSCPALTGAWAVAVSPDDKLVAVSNVNGNSVTFVDTSSNQIVSTISVGVAPGALAFAAGGSKLYVANGGDQFGHQSISVIDVASRAVTQTITPIGGADGVAASPAGDMVFVVEGGFGLAMISTATDQVVSQIQFGDGGMEGGIAVSPDGSKIFVTDFGGHDPRDGTIIPATVFVVDVAQRAVIGSAQTTPGLDQMALSSDGRTAFIITASDLSNGIVSFDTQTLTFGTVAHPASIPDGIALISR